MMILDNNQKAFLALVVAGLWEQDTQLLPFGKVEFESVMLLAEDQTVVGVVTAGMEHVQDVKIPQEELLQFVGLSLQLEHQNEAMNKFIVYLIDKLRKDEIYAVLVKGQGVAQCYERPLWRACGDVDLLLSDSNYEKAKKVLIPFAEDIEKEYKDCKHISVTMHGGFPVELHGTLHSHFSRRVDRGIDEVQRDVFCGGNVRSWQNGLTTIFLPAPDNDVIFVFTHILQHFFSEGVGLRQVCDWCRLLWTYHNDLDTALLNKRLHKMGLMAEWRAFAAFAVEYLGMPVEAMPLYAAEKKWSKKAEKILRLILELGNFGHGRDMSYKQKYPKAIEYLISFMVYSKYSFLQFQIFPFDAMKGWGRTITLGVKNKIKKN